MSIIDATKEQQTTVVGTKEQNDTAVKPVKEEKMIVMDGPLSKVYTEALQIAFSKEAPQGADGVAAESMAADGSLVTTIIASLLDNNYAKQDTPVSYVYVTDTDKIEDEPVAETFDKINTAIANENYTEVVVCIESLGSIGTHSGLINNSFATNPKVKFFYSKKNLTKYLTGK